MKQNGPQQFLAPTRPTRPQPAHWAWFPLGSRLLAESSGADLMSLTLLVLNLAILDSVYQIPNTGEELVLLYPHPPVHS